MGEIKTLETKKTAAEQFELLMELACANGALIEDGLASMQDRIRIVDFKREEVGIASISVYGYGDDPYDPSKRVISIGMPFDADSQYISVYLERTWQTVSICIEGESDNHHEHSADAVLLEEDTGRYLMERIATGILEMRDMLIDLEENEDDDDPDPWDNADAEYENWRDQREAGL